MQRLGFRALFATLAIAATAAIAAPGAAIADTVTPAPSAPLAATYVIHEFDLLDIQVFNDPSLSQNVTVLPDGNVNYPLVGAVHLAGLSPQQAGAAMKRALSKYLRNPNVNVSVLRQGQLDVLVLGNVAHPGKYSLPSNARLTDAIAAAGGMGDTNGTYLDARIAQSDGSSQNVSLEKLLRGGDTSLDVKLKPDAAVYVPAPTTFYVLVNGAVDHPGAIQLQEGDRLAIALAKAGTSTASNADLNRVNITRQMPDGSQKAYTVNLYKDLQSGDLKSDIVMQKNDVVFVPQAGVGYKTTTQTAASALLLTLARLLIIH